MKINDGISEIFRPCGEYGHAYLQETSAKINYKTCPQIFKFYHQ